MHCLYYLILINEILSVEDSLAWTDSGSAGFGCLERSHNGTGFKF